MLPKTMLVPSFGQDFKAHRKLDGLILQWPFLRPLSHITLSKWMCWRQLKRLYDTFVAMLFRIAEQSNNTEKQDFWIVYSGVTTSNFWLISNYCIFLKWRIFSSNLMFWMSLLWNAEPMWIQSKTTALIASTFIHLFFLLQIFFSSSNLFF